MIMTFVFDMDGTIADLYAVENWLDKLRAYDPSPYEEARPLVNLSRLARKLNKLQSEGANICIVSWGSKVSTDDYLEAVAEAKRKWLAKHLKSVHWDEISVVPYGTPKPTACSFYNETTAILFDDEERNREQWGELSFDATEIFDILSQF